MPNNLISKCCDKCIALNGMNPPLYICANPTCPCHAILPEPEKANFIMSEDSIKALSPATPMDGEWEKYDEVVNSLELCLKAENPRHQMARVIHNTISQAVSEATRKQREAMLEKVKNVRTTVKDPICLSGARRMREEIIEAIAKLTSKT